MTQILVHEEEAISLSSLPCNTVTHLTGASGDE